MRRLRLLRLHRYVSSRATARLSVSASLFLFSPPGTGTFCVAVIPGSLSILEPDILHLELDPGLLCAVYVCIQIVTLRPRPRCRDTAPFEHPLCLGVSTKAFPLLAFARGPVRPTQNRHPIGPGSSDCLGPVAACRGERAGMTFPRGRRTRRRPSAGPRA